MGQQLIAERRANKLLEDKLQKTKLKMQVLKKKTHDYQTEIQEYIEQFKKFVVQCEIDRLGKLAIEINEKKKECCLKISSKSVKTEMLEFFNFIKRKSSVAQKLEEDIET